MFSIVHINTIYLLLPATSYIICQTQFNMVEYSIYIYMVAKARRYNLSNQHCKKWYFPIIYIKITSIIILICTRQEMNSITMKGILNFSSQIVFQTLWIQFILSRVLWFVESCCYRLLYFSFVAIITTFSRFWIATWSLLFICLYLLLRANSKKAGIL